MPNHIANTLYADREVIDFIFKDSDQFDFNKIIPMPDILAVTEHQGDIESIIKCIFGLPLNTFPNGEIGEAYKQLQISNRISKILSLEPMLVLLGNPEKDKAAIEQLCQAIKNQYNYGHFSWYTWSTENWGTKWNSYNNDKDRRTETSCHFETAWSPPLQVILKLSEMFPQTKITLKTADEDIGQQCNIITFLNGEVAEITTLSDKDAIKHYFLVRHNLKSPSKEVLKDYGFDEEFNRIEDY